jgi:glycosyltransferase involved in cell wall biosynthesis
MPRPLRFCHLTTFYPPYNFGGDGIGIQRLCRALVRRGHHVTVVHDKDAYDLLHPGPSPEPEVDPDGVEVVTLESGLGAASCLLTQQTGRPVVHGRRLRRILDEGRFDVLNYHNVSLAGGPGLWALGDAVKLHMAHEHWLVCESHTLWRHGRERCDRRECLRCVVNYRRPPQLWRRTGAIARQGRNVDLWIAMSEFSRDKHAEMGFPFPMEVMPYFLPEPAGGADPDAPPRPDPTERHRARPYFLFVGRLERLKGLQDVIPVFRERPEVDLVVTGTGEYEGELRALAAGMDNVHFVGRVPQDELARTYRHAEALIVPSLCFETFGIILIEAFSSGLPVIARRVGPFPEIVESSGGGELFRDAGELLAAMDRIRSDPAHRDRLAAAGWRAFSERWTERAVMPRYLELVRQAANRSGHAEVARALAGSERSSSSASLDSPLTPQTGDDPSSELPPPRSCAAS